MAKKNFTLLSVIEYLTTLSYRNLFGLWIGMVIVFAAAFAALATFMPEHGISNIAKEPPVKRMLDSLYFSVMTSTTVGYGDITPLGFSRLLAIIESILGLFGAGIFLAKITSAKQDLALEQIHKVSLDSVSRQIREELFILRRDFDGMIAEAMQEGTVSKKSWQNLKTACAVAQMRLEDISQLYASSDLYTIDAKREDLLLDGLSRTLAQLSQLLGLLKDGNLSKEHPETAAELRAFLQALAELLPHWQKDSPHRVNDRHFAELEQLVKRLQTHVM